jgi:hypothetical protein
MIFPFSCGDDGGDVDAEAKGAPQSVWIPRFSKGGFGFGELGISKTNPFVWMEQLAILWCFSMF